MGEAGKIGRGDGWVGRVEGIGGVRWGGSGMECREKRKRINSLNEHKTNGTKRIDSYNTNELIRIRTEFDFP